MALESAARIQLRDFIVEHFNRAELWLFCHDFFFDFYKDYDGTNLPLTTLALRLIEHCENRDAVAHLRANLQRQRPQPYADAFGTLRVPEVKAQPRNPRQVFLSHAHEDADFAHRLAADLRAAGLAVWMTPDSIQPGESWVSAIDRGLSECGLFGVVLTPDAVKSSWVKLETQYAIQAQQQGHAQLAPLLVKPCEVGQLSSLLTLLQYVNFERGYGQGLEAVCRLFGVRRVVEQTIARPAMRTRPVPAEARRPNELMLNLSPTVQMEFVLVPAGEFLMGSDKAKDSQADDNELPQHKVFLSDYYIGKYPITNAQYATYAQATNVKFSIPSRKEKHPVVNVSWDAASAFSTWMSQQTKRAVALPSEAQWEVRHEVAWRPVARSKEMPPDSLLSASYLQRRHRQRRGLKLQGQCSLTSRRDKGERELHLVISNTMRSGARNEQ